MKLFPSRCYNGGQQHRFEARHSTHTIPMSVEEFSGSMGALTRALEAGTERIHTYHGDVCVWCGKIVNQPGVKS